MRVEDSYGIDSRVSGSSELHWFMLDLDGWDFTVYRTPHGSHLIIFVPFRFASLVRHIVAVDAADKEWVRQGVRRGYFYLQSHYPVIERMRVQRIRK